MSGAGVQDELGGAAEPTLAAADRVADGWLKDLEESGNGCLEACGRTGLRRLLRRVISEGHHGVDVDAFRLHCDAAEARDAARALRARARAVLQPEARYRDALQALHSLAAVIENRQSAPQRGQPVSRHVHRASLAMQRATSPVGVGRALVRAAVRLTEAAGAVWWERGNGGQLTAVASQGVRLRKGARAFSPPSGFWGTRGSGAPIIHLSSSRPEWEQFLRRFDAPEAVIVRGYLGRQWVGALSLHGSGLERGRVDLLVPLVQQAVLALRTLRLSSEAAQLLQNQQQSVSELGRALSSALSEDELLKTIRSVASSVGGSDLVYLFLADDGGGLRLRSGPEGGQAPPVDRNALLRTANRVRREPMDRALWETGGRMRGPGTSALREAGFRSVLGVPIYIRGQALGALLVLSTSQEALDPSRRQMMLSFAGEAGVAIENLHLVENMQRRLLEMADLTWVSTRVAATLDAQKIAETITDAAAKALDVPRAALFVCDAAGLLQPVAGGQYGFDTDLEAIDPNGGVAGIVLASGVPQAVVDALDNGRVDDPLVRALRARSLLCAPMCAQQGLSGVLVVADDRSRTYPTHVVALVSAYANQAALALQSARLYQETVRHLTQLSTLFEVSRSLASSLDLNQTLEIVLDSAALLLDAPVCSVALLDPETGTLAMKAAHGLHPDDSMYQPLRPGEGLGGRALQAGTALTSADISRDGRFTQRQRAREEGLRAAIAAPLIARGRTIGVIELYRKSPREFTEDDKRILVSLADSASVAIENANLYAEARERSQFLTAMMAEINHRMRNTLQAAAGLLHMELDRAQPRSTHEAIHRGIARLQTAAVIHELLRAREFEFVDMKQAARRIVDIIRQTTSLSVDIEVTVGGTRVMLPSQMATDVALVLGELIDNAVRHGIGDAKTGRVAVNLTEVGGDVLIQVSDTGPGLPEGFDLNTMADVGLKIVRGIVEQDLRGNLTLESGNGLTVRARFPKH